jgi:hypothetical protein
MLKLLASQISSGLTINNLYPVGFDPDDETS